MNDNTEISTTPTGGQANDNNKASNQDDGINPAEIRWMNFLMKAWKGCDVVALLSVSRALERDQVHICCQLILGTRMDLTEFV